MNGICEKQILNGKTKRNIEWIFKNKILNGKEIKNIELKEKIPDIGQKLPDTYHWWWWWGTGKDGKG